MTKHCQEVSVPITWALSQITSFNFKCLQSIAGCHLVDNICLVLILSCVEIYHQVQNQNFSFAMRVHSGMTFF